MIGTVDLLTLLALPRVGPKTVLRLAREAEHAEQVSGIERLLERLERISLRRFVIPPFDIDDAGRIAQMMLAQAERSGITVVGWFDEAYPDRLRDIPDPPVVLFVRGDLSAVNQTAIAVIGTREPTPFGAETARRIGRRLAVMGVTVVSGLALGCDTAAHIGSLEGGGRTVAVMAHGLDTTYPARNRDLAEQIVASGGALVSEYPPGVRPRRGNFVARDRLQSGLSCGVLVIETGPTGGSMHTVRAALAQRRALACIAHPPKYADEPQVQGNRILRERGDALPLKEPPDLENFVRLCQNEGETEAETTALPRQLGLQDDGGNF